MGKPSLRGKILRTGMRLMFRSGYQGATVRDICAAAGAPQGSFTNHFRSKEAFAEEVLDQYFDYLKGLVKQALNDETRTPRQRLKLARAARRNCSRVAHLICIVHCRGTVCGRSRFKV